MLFFLSQIHIDSSLHLHCKHLRHQNYVTVDIKKFTTFLSKTFSRFLESRTISMIFFHTYMGSHEDWKNLKTASRAGTTWPCEFRNWRLGFSAQLLKTLRWILNYASLFYLIRNFWPTHVFYSFSLHNKYIFLHFTLLVKHISSINIFQIFIHIYFK